ncbi:MAG: substrate-binding domain-containing protein [Aerococcaceae bacterium]|nr:substrate-binding domain-containing protein [Aerococcaceae bacterium]
MKKKNFYIGVALLGVLVGLYLYAQQTKHPRLAAKQPIIVVSREAGSGTRGAFVDIVEVKDANGDDNITVEADVLNGTSGVMQVVAGNPNAIGYISYGSLNDSVKAIAVDGVAISPENVKSGDYTLARPFNVAWSKKELSPLADDFLNFIFSKEGQAMVEDEGYISVGTRPSANQTYQDVSGQPLQPYQPTNLSGQLNVIGSTSLTPVVEKLAERYMTYNPAVKISITSNGSTAGLAAAIDGTADLGMASRELKAAEQEQLHSVAIALDGIVIIVHPESAYSELPLDTIRAIYSGEIFDWESVKQ